MQTAHLFLHELLSVDWGFKQMKYVVTVWFSKWAESILAARFS